MSDYIKINFDVTSAGPKAVEWDKAMVVGDGSPSTLSESKVYDLTSDNWSTQLGSDGFAEGDQLYDSVSLFFSAIQTPQRVFAYAYISGSATNYLDTPLKYVEDNLFETPIKPPRNFVGNEKVKFYCKNLTGYTENYADGSVGIGFTPETDQNGNWTGRITFPNGLSGTCGIITTLDSAYKITADFSIGTEGGIGEAIEEYSISMISVALENNKTLKNYSYNLFGSQVQDMLKMTSTIAGKNCMFFYALPGNANPDDTISGTSLTWKELKNLLGARRDIAVIKVMPSASNHDMATGYMAMTSITRPHQQLTFAEPHMGIQQQENAINRSKWRDGQIASTWKNRRLSGNPFLITYGFTFGSGDVDRIEGARCQFIIAETLTNNIWGLLARRETLMSYKGMQKLKAVITATFKTLQDQKIVDGLRKIYIPIEEDLLKNTEAGKIARQQHLCPAVEIDYEWFTSLEKIYITKVSNVAT